MNDAKISRPVALVTGAFRGIGLACARRLAAAGFNLVLNDRATEENQARVTELEREFADAGAAAIARLGDIGNVGGHAALMAAAFERWGRLDCLVNNAGVAARQRGDLLDVSPESFDACVQVNARAVFFLTQAFARELLKTANPAAGHRSIITITSSNAVAVSISRGEYCVSKAAASMVTSLFALRLASAGIGVYEVRPGLIETDMTRPAKARYDAMIAGHRVPAERWGFPDDVAAAVTTLAEGKLPYTVGQVITVDGGLITPQF